MCHCGEPINLTRTSNPKTNIFQETAGCTACNRLWINTVNPNVLDPKPKIPLGERHPRPRVKKDK